jgi:hypothetical protein
MNSPSSTTTKLTPFTDPLKGCLIRFIVAFHLVVFLNSLLPLVMMTVQSHNVPAQEAFVLIHPSGCSGTGHGLHRVLPARYQLVFLP